MRRQVVVALVLAGCGRHGFAPVPDGAVADDDAPAPDDSANRPDCAAYQGALFCDGFEDPALAAWQLRGSVSRVNTGVLRGTAALQADTQTTQEVSEAGLDFGPIASGLLAVRGWFYVPSGFQVIHFDLIDIKGTAGGLAVLGYMNSLVLYQNTAGSGVTIEQPPLPLDRWMCLELQIEVIDPGRVDLLLDGAVAASFTNLDLLPGSGFGRLTVGLPWTDDGQTPARAFVDEVVIDTQPIGCN